MLIPTGIRGLTVAGVVVVAVFLAAGFASAGSDTDGEYTAELPHPTLLPPTRGDERPVFSTDVTAAAERRTIQRDGYTISLATAAGGICFALALPSGTRSEGCFDEPTLSAGVAYGAFQDHDGPVYMFGVVPDEVVSVSIDGRLVPVDRNVWTYVGDGGSDLRFAAASADGRQSPLLGS